MKMALTLLALCAFAQSALATGPDCRSGELRHLDPRVFGQHGINLLGAIGMEVNMDAAFSFLISVGIIAFGIWIVAGTIAAGSPLAWTLMGLLTVIVGSISLYQAIGDVKIAIKP